MFCLKFVPIPIHGCFNFKTNGMWCDECFDHVGLFLQILITLAAICAIALAAPLDDSANAQILKYESENIGIGGYKFS